MGKLPKVFPEKDADGQIKYKFESLLSGTLYTSACVHSSALTIMSRSAIEYMTHDKLRVSSWWGTLIQSEIMVKATVLLRDKIRNHNLQLR